MSTTFIPRDPTAIDYPDSDGQPISDSTLQFRRIVLIKERLEALFRHDPCVFVAGELLWYPEEGNPKIRQAPDALVAIGRPKGERGSYKQWVEGGIAPQVVFEVLSPNNRFKEMLRKFQFYDRYGVEEYDIYDPDNGELEGWCRKDGILEEITDFRKHVSPRLGIRFEPGDGPDNLKIIAPDGNAFVTHQELADRAETERQRAETERQRAEAERQRAESESLRADRLAAKLRELGIETE